MSAELASNGHGALKVPRDLRELFERLREEGRVIHIDRAALPEPDIASYCKAASELAGTALWFDDIVGFRRNRLVVNLLASWQNCALMLGLPSDLTIAKLVEEICSRSGKQTYKPMFMDEGMAPSYECLETGEVNLYKTLPLFRVNEHDGGFYLHKACIVSGEMTTGARLYPIKFGMYSLQVQGRDRLGVHLSGTDNLSLHVGIAEKANRRLPVAVCLGVPPLASMVASAAISYERTEYNVISALSQRPFELTQCIQSKLCVPAYSEYVLEGYIEPGVRCPEGPFMGNRGDLSELKRQPQIIVTAVAHRNDPILDNAYVGKSWTELDCLHGIACSLRLLKQAKEFMPEIARSGTRAEGVHLRVDFCSGGRGGKRSTAGMSFQDVLPEENCLSVYKQDIEAVRRRRPNATA